MNICDGSILHSTVKLKVCLFGHWQNIRDCSTQIYITSEDFSQLNIIFLYSLQTPCIITITTMMSSMAEETSTKPDMPLLSFLLLFYLIDLQETPLKFQRKELDLCTPWTNITYLQLRSRRSYHNATMKPSLGLQSTPQRTTVSRNEPLWDTTVNSCFTP